MASVSVNTGLSKASANFAATIYLPDTMQSGTSINGSLDFTMTSGGAYYNAESPLSYSLIVHERNQSGTEIATTTVISNRIIYYPKYSTVNAQWASGKIYNWNISSGFSTVKNIWQTNNMYSEVPTWSYATLRSWLNSNGASAGSYNYYISTEPLLVRYASDNLSGRQNVYSPTSISSAMKWSSANPYRGSSTTGNRDHSHSAVGFSLGLNPNTSSLEFEVTFSYMNAVRWPSDYASNPATHVNTFSHIYRHNGSSFQKNSVVYQFDGSNWKKCRIYRYDGSRWNNLV
jgi:hypothetical protein